MWFCIRIYVCIYICTLKWPSSVVIMFSFTLACPQPAALPTVRTDWNKCLPWLQRSFTLLRSP